MTSTPNRQADPGFAHARPDNSVEPASSLRRGLLALEERIDRWSAGRRRRRGRTRPATVVPYAGYAHSDGCLAMGRVMELPREWTPEETDGRLANLRGVGALFATHEIAHAGVLLRHWGGETLATSDAEGYLRETVPAPDAPALTCWDTLTATLQDGEREAEPGDAVELPILRVGTSARFAVVSDIDDTVMRTGAENLARNLWTTFTGNPLTRQVYEHVPALYRALARHEGRRTNPIFYLSSSPWNLYGVIHDVLERNGVPWGPIFLRDFGFDETKFIKSTHGDHKLTEARRLMESLDGLPFLLIGDLGQADAEIYAELARRRPDQVMGVIVHQPSQRLHEQKRRHIEEIEALGIPVLVTTDYSEADDFARSHGWIDR